MNKLTIFTPTYNRANLLPNLYKSLVKQSNKNFIRIDKIKDKFKTEYKLPFIYKVFGILFSSKFYQNYKKEVKNRQLK